MTVTEARKYARQFTKNHSIFIDDEIDRAIIVVCGQVSHDLHLNRITSTATFTIGSESVDLSGPITAGLTPNRIERFYLTGTSPAWTGTPEIDIVDADEIEDDKIGGADQSGRPIKLAFEDMTTPITFPIPDVAYTAKVRWFAPFAAWTPGANGDAINIDLPDEILRIILSSGVPACLQRSQLENVNTTVVSEEGWYRIMIGTLRSMGSLGVRSIRRTPWER